jgi:hypothetical protein
LVMPSPGVLSSAPPTAASIPSVSLPIPTTPPKSTTPGSPLFSLISPEHFY